MRFLSRFDAEAMTITKRPTARKPAASTASALSLTRAGYIKQTLARAVRE